MFLFLRLVLAHALADFPLQFDALYRIKTKSFFGQLLHGLVVGLCMLLLGFPYISQPLFWFFIIFLVTTHILQDTNKILFNKLLSEKENIWIFLVDQVLHLGFIALVIPLKIGNAAPDLLLPDYLQWYMNNDTVLFLSFFIFLSFGLTYFIPLLQAPLLKKEKISIPLTKPDRWYGIGERSCIFILMVLVPMSIFISFPVSLALKAIYASTAWSKRKGNEPFSASVTTTILGNILVICGWVAFKFLQGCI